MISAFARAGIVLGDQKYEEAAIKATEFVKSQLYKNGKLIRNFRENPSNISAFADDYAFMITALIDLYECFGDVQWLKWAIQLQETMDNLFYDTDNGGYFGVEQGDPNLVIRMKEEYDGAEPSPNSFAVHNLVRLYNITQKDEYQQKVKKTLGSFAKELQKTPMIFPHMVAALDLCFEKLRQIVIVGNPKEPATKEFMKTVNSFYIPNKVVVYADGGEGQNYLCELGVDYVTQHDMKIDVHVTAQVCQNQTCQIAENNAELENLLSK